MNKSFYNKKKIFITGHTGFKGSWLSKMLVMCGAKVKGYSLEPNTEPSLFTLLELDKKTESVIGDIRDYNNMYKEMEKFSPDIVIHLAAQPIVRESYIDPKSTYESNVMGTVNILECIRNIKSVKSALIITTDKVYKDKNMINGYRESDELCGYDPYSNSKSCAELVYYSYYNCFFKENDSISISTARAGNVIGGGDFAKDRIIPDLVRSYIKGNDLELRNPHSIRPYQHVLDALNGYLILIEKQYNDKSIEGCYNFGPNDSYSVNTGSLATLFCNKVNNEIKWTTNCTNKGPHESNILVLDSTKARKLLNWKDLLDINATMDEIVSWTNAYKNKKNIIKNMENTIEEFIKKE